MPRLQVEPDSSTHVTDASVLVVDDDRTLATTISKALWASGYRASIAPSGAEALAASSLQEPDVVILDLGLPDLDGIDVCRQLRRWFRNPIIVVSGDNSEDRKIAALDEGADDYITKPFSMPELFARIRVALRHRALVASVVDDAHIDIGDLHVEIGERTAYAGGVPLELTRKEFDLLALLARNPGRVVTRTTLLEHAWGSAGAAKPEVLRVHMTQLRHKLGAGPQRPRIVSAPGVGYRLVLDAPGEGAE